MSKHTPGPWETTPLHGESYGRRIFSGTQYIGCVGDSDQKSPAEANARLIAAAPDLLEALELCDEVMSYMSEYDIPLTLPEKVKTAIAKAKGEE